MLRDSGLQYNFLSYVDVIQKGIPKEYKVLILPACLCLSDVEAKRIETFCRDGGTVIADYLPGLWDQHGKGRRGGVLDEMFGVKHDANLRAQDVFGGTLWCEIDQDANFSWKTYQEFMTNKNTCTQDVSGFDKAVRKMPVDHINGYGKGKAILMNLSPQWYNAYRVAGFEASRKRDVFVHHLTEAGVARWVHLKNAGETEHGYEITYWQKEGRTIVCLCLNPEVAGSQLGGGNAVGLKTRSIPVKFCFTANVESVRDERSGKELGHGKEFGLDWAMNEAKIVSFSGPPPR